MKYNFEGIAKASALPIFAALAASPLSFLTTGILGKFTFFMLTKFTNWLANTGLIIANVGVEYISSIKDKSAYDKAMDEAIKKVTEKKGRLTEKEIKEIDDAVIKAFDKFGVFVRER